MLTPPRHGCDRTGRPQARRRDGMRPAIARMSSQPQCPRPRLHPHPRHAALQRRCPGSQQRRWRQCWARAARSQGMHRQRLKRRQSRRGCQGHRRAAGHLHRPAHLPSGIAGTAAHALLLRRRRRPLQLQLLRKRRCRRSQPDVVVAAQRLRCHATCRVRARRQNNCLRD
jgi:hypothetical protein